MQIKQLSAMLDNKLAELDARVVRQEKILSTTDIDTEKNKIQQELNELSRLRDKLIKSRDLAWEAHSLERNSNKQLNQRKAIIGLALCVVGGLAALVLIVILVKQFI
jgi:hypothetical protein